MTQSFEDYLEAARKAKDTDALFEVFSKTIAARGYDRSLLAFITDDKAIDQTAGIGVMQNFPPGWWDYYTENNFAEVDPVPKFALFRSVAFSWDEIMEKFDLTEEEKLCLNTGIDSGLHNGVSTLIRAAPNRIAGMSFATSEKKDACDNDKDFLTACGNHFYTCYRQLKGIKDPEPLNITLNQRQRDVLCYAYHHKTNWEIGMLLSPCVSKHEVDRIFRIIYKKLEVHDRQSAVNKAVNYGLITI